MTNISDMIASLTPAQRDSLTALLLQQVASAPQTAVAEAPVAEPSTFQSSYYDMEQAVAVTFKATLSVNDKSRDKSYAERFDHLWCKGNYRVKGPKGGVYFVGRAVMGVKKGQQVKGTLRVGNKYFEAFLDGAPMDAWFRPEGESESILIGTLTNFRAV